MQKSPENLDSEGKNMNPWNNESSYMLLLVCQPPSRIFPFSILEIN